MYMAVARTACGASPGADQAGSGRTSPGLSFARVAAFAVPTPEAVATTALNHLATPEAEPHLLFVAFDQDDEPTVDCAPASGSSSLRCRGFDSRSGMGDVFRHLRASAPTSAWSVALLTWEY
jgi:hypothetical protein